MTGKIENARRRLRDLLQKLIVNVDTMNEKNVFILLGKLEKGEWIEGDQPAIEGDQPDQSTPKM
ncbi:hypothetical protein [Bradyrhizobium sp. SZCCHNRI2010]|uniref:hypothetical protein n=1 Tax=Bradyrhizobium sp. SZCCHNRI2010 TaxID=3057283 RepID=UPI0028E4459E|nr:hypothetical protein [Bradyrhizobium sp. SZCCHNRI2010]